MKIAFSDLFDSGSRYKVLAKKQEFNRQPIKSPKQYDSNVSFDGKNNK